MARGATAECGGSGARTAEFGPAFRRGFVAMLPLWPGVLPFAVTFAILARTAGFTPWETQAFSLFVFAGSAQVATVTLFSAGANPAAIVLTAFLLNLRHVLYGLSLSRQFDRTPVPSAVLAYFLTDEAYGVTIRDTLDGRGGPVFLLGASLNLFVSFNLATFAGAAVGALLPDPRGLGLDFIFPLTFVALLVPLLRSWRQLLVAGVAGAAALILGRLAPGGVAILGATVLAAAFGVALDLRRGDG